MNDNKPFEDLANAIILQAITDWLNCHKSVDGEYIHPHDSTVNRKEIESFFRSQWFTCLSSVDPEFIIETLKKDGFCS